MNDALATYDSAAVMEGGQARFAMDKKLFVQFYLRPVMNAFKSAEAGRPIFDELEYVRIIIPGDKNTVIDTKATREHTEIRFSSQYEKFRKNQEQAVSGTPLEVWPQLTVGQVAELKALNISTVEQLADLPDNLAQRIMGSHTLRQKAKTFLDAAAGEAVNTKLQMELEKRDGEIELLKAQMQQLMTAKVKAKE
jgi:hypothetical protein